MKRALARCVLAACEKGARVHSHRAAGSVAQRVTVSRARRQHDPRPTAASTRGHAETR